MGRSGVMRISCMSWYGILVRARDHSLKNALNLFWMGAPLPVCASHRIGSGAAKYSIFHSAEGAAAALPMNCVEKALVWLSSAAICATYPGRANSFLIAETSFDGSLAVS